MQNKIEISVEWGDTDPAEIVFYPNFFKWFDTGTWRLFDAAGLTYDVIRNDFSLIGFPLVEVRSKFISPVHFRDPVQLTSHIFEWGRKTFQVSHTVLVKDRPCVEGLETRVLGRRADDGAIEAVIPPKEIQVRLPALKNKDLQSTEK